MARKDGRKREFVERVGEFFARTGHPRIAGRLLGWLLICDPPHQSAEELAGVTQASKASISVMLRLLGAAGLVERIGVPGERRSFYRIRGSAWSEDLSTKAAHFSEMRKIAEAGLELVDGDAAEQRRGLTNMRDFYGFFEREFPELLRRWEAKRGKRG